MSDSDSNGVAATAGRAEKYHGVAIRNLSTPNLRQWEQLCQMHGWDEINKDVERALEATR